MSGSTRYSKKREAILNTICSTKVHPTADWVYQQLRTEHPDLSLGTVYRNINLFCEQGLVKSIGVVNGQERFDGNVMPHSHFICEHCGSVIDLDSLVPDPKLISEIEKEYMVKINRHELTFHGLCPICSEEIE